MDDQQGASVGVLELGPAGTPLSWTGVGAVNTGWALGSDVDVNGDGQPDLIFQNGTELGAIQMGSGFAPVSWKIV